ncbi:putative transferase [Helianthus anomalus]
MLCWMVTFFCVVRSMSARCPSCREMLVTFLGPVKEMLELEDGGVTDEVMKELDITKCSVIIGFALGGMKIFQDAIEALRVSYKKMNLFCVPFAMDLIISYFGWMGPNYSISTACATSNYCILNAANHIIRGETDTMLSGGSDSAIIPISIK